MVWIFGYGSLIWKVGFPYERQVEGCVRGYKRRFWWLSEDHRGVPGAPGLVVTLFPTGDQRDEVWGVAYEVCDVRWEQSVAAHLDHGEKGGYERREEVFHPRASAEEDGDGQSEAGKPVTLYLGSRSDRLFAGELTDEKAAEVIARAVGPSGANKEYLINLAAAVKERRFPEDGHLASLEKLVKAQSQDAQR